MLTAKKVRLWYRIHKWTSLVCTAFLLMSCLTGLPLIFHDEIAHFTNHEVHPKALPDSTSYAALQPMIEAGLLRFPGQKIFSVGWDDDEPRIFVNVAPNFDPKPNEGHTLAFDAHTGDFLEELGERHDLLYYATNLHVELFAGLGGELLLGGMAILFLLALISGVLVYGPFMRRLDFGTVRKQAHSRTKWFDLHNLIGIVTFTWALVVGATGAMNTLSDPLFDAWRAQEMPQLLAPFHGRPMPQHFSSLDAAIDKTHQSLPHAVITSVFFPNPKYGSPRHYLFWTHGKSPITSLMFVPVLIDVETGNVAMAKGLPWYLRALELSRPLHFGDYGGMPLKIIWALFDVALIVVLLSGSYLWLSRRKTPVEKELDRLVKMETLAAEETPAVGVVTR